MQIRNVAIVAHVDHRKTILVDKLLGQSGSFRERPQVAHCGSVAAERDRNRRHADRRAVRRAHGALRLIGYAFMSWWTSMTLPSGS